MQYGALVLLVCIGLAAGFQTLPFRRLHNVRQNALMMSESESETTTPVPPTPAPVSTPPKADASYAIVPLEKETVENAAATTAVIAGFIIAGPVGAVALGATANYLVKKENEVAEALQGVGKTVIEVVNYVTKVNSKYELTDKAGSAVGGAIDSADNEALSTVKKTLSEATGKISALNEEYKIVNTVGEALTVAKGLSDQAIDKVGELNEKVKQLKQ
jgi:hypothetical protein